MDNTNDQFISCSKDKPPSQEEKEYSLWGSNPRPMAHKTIALTSELREPNKEMLFKKTMFHKREEWNGYVSVTLLGFTSSFYSLRIRNAGYSSVGRASDCRLLQQSDGPWFDSGWPDFNIAMFEGSQKPNREKSFAGKGKRCACRESNPGHKHGRLV